MRKHKNYLLFLSVLGNPSCLKSFFLDKHPFIHHSPWCRHQMETFSALLAFCAGNSPVPVNSPHKGQWREALMFSLICAWINDWVNNREAGDLRRHRGHYDVNVMQYYGCWWPGFLGLQGMTKHDVDLMLMEHSGLSTKRIKTCSSFPLYLFHPLRQNTTILHTDGLVQERRNSSALAMELCLSCMNRSISSWYILMLLISISFHFTSLSFSLSCLISSLLLSLPANLVDYDEDQQQPYPLVNLQPPPQREVYWSFFELNPRPYLTNMTL